MIARLVVHYVPVPTLSVIRYPTTERQGSPESLRVCAKGQPCAPIRFPDSPQSSILQAMRDRGAHGSLQAEIPIGESRERSECRRRDRWFQMIAQNLRIADRDRAVAPRKIAMSA